MPALSDLARGQRGTVVAVHGADGVSQRLMEMGMLEGETVEVVGFAPLGDPIEVRVQDYHLSLRKAEAARVLVTLS
jgi:ferrous iron transport protein A